MIDLIAMKSTGVIDTRPYSGPHGMAIHPDGSLFVTCDKSNATLVVDPQSRRIIEAIEMPSHGGHFLTMTTDGAKAYVSIHSVRSRSERGAGGGGRSAGTGAYR